MQLGQGLLFKTITASGIIETEKARIHGLLIGTDGVNDPTVTVYDNTAASGDKVVPSNTYDASKLGLNGFTLFMGVRCNNGLYVEITCAGTCEVTVHYRNW